MNVHTYECVGNGVTVFRGSMTADILSDVEKSTDLEARIARLENLPTLKAALAEPITAVDLINKTR